MCIGRLKSGSRLELFDTARKKLVSRDRSLILADVSASGDNTFVRVTEGGRPRSMKVLRNATLWDHGSRQIRCVHPDTGDMVPMTHDLLIELGCFEGS